jgi:hypothetical protein
VLESVKLIRSTLVAERRDVPLIGFSVGRRDETPSSRALIIHSCRHCVFLLVRLRGQAAPWTLMFYMVSSIYAALRSPPSTSLRFASAVKSGGRFFEEEQRNWRKMARGPPRRIRRTPEALDYCCHRLLVSAS